jgi:hypothetical protein
MADQRIQATENMVGANHPTLADTLNRLTLVQHNTDGTHVLTMTAQANGFTIAGGTTSKTLTVPLDASVSGTLICAPGKTFTCNHTITLAGTDAKTYTFPTTNATLARTDAAQTFTGIQSFSNTTASQGQVSFHKLVGNGVNDNDMLLTEFLSDSTSLGKFGIRWLSGATIFTWRNLYSSGSTGSTELMNLNASGDLWISGNCSAASFTDRTPYPAGEYDALTEINNIQGLNGEVDHTTLPEFVKVEKDNGVVERDLGAMISVLTIGMQQLEARLKALEP